MVRQTLPDELQASQNNQCRVVIPYQVQIKLLDKNGHYGRKKRLKMGEHVDCTITKESIGRQSNFTVGILHAEAENIKEWWLRICDELTAPLGIDGLYDGTE